MNIVNLINKILCGTNKKIVFRFQGNHPLVNDLFMDLRDGTRLLALLEVLTAREYVSTRDIPLEKWTYRHVYVVLGSAVVI